MNALRMLLDRTAVLFLGVAAGTAIGYAYGQGGGHQDAASQATAISPRERAPAEIASPAPSAAAAPDSRPAAEIVAEIAEVPPVPSEPPSADPVRAGPVVRVGVFGDSFGDGVYSALYRLLPAKDGYKVVKYSQPSTGFTRYRRLNLEAHDAEQIGDEPIDIAVISFGANDAQGVCEGSRCGKLMSSFWQDVIGRRVEAYVRMLRDRGATVYWVGLPAMRDAGFDGDTRAMDAFFRDTMARLGVPYIDIRSLTVDGHGRYVAYYRDADGAPKLLRAGDGVHMSMNGYLRVTKALADRIRNSVQAARLSQPTQEGVGG